MSDKKEKEINTKKIYEKPAVKTESLTAVAAVCNGTLSGGRKAAQPACNATKIKS
jgi:geranylgeranyl pyrophosphate synthase